MALVVFSQQSSLLKKAKQLTVHQANYLTNGLVYFSKQVLVVT
jgi:hypothetical protein